MTLKMMFVVVLMLRFIIKLRFPTNVAFKDAVKNDLFCCFFLFICLFNYLSILCIIVIRIGFLSDNFLDFKHGPLKSSLPLTG